MVATVLTVYGIETFITINTRASLFKLQQYLPFTVLKPINEALKDFIFELQQYLPFTVLKHNLDTL